MHVSVDLETFGSRPGSVIASMGAVAFDPVTGQLGPEFYQVIDVASAERLGLSIDADTVKWWLRQGEAARLAVADRGLDVTAALQLFAVWWDSVGGRTIWSHGANFDEPMLAWAYQAADLRRPWSYSASRCTRTIFDLAGVSPDRAVGAHHNALDDARAQAMAVCAAYIKLGLANPPAVSGTAAA